MKNTPVIFFTMFGKEIVLEATTINTFKVLIFTLIFPGNRLNNINSLFIKYYLLNFL